MIEYAALRGRLAFHEPGITACGEFLRVSAGVVITTPSTPYSLHTFTTLAELEAALVEHSSVTVGWLNAQWLIVGNFSDGHAGLRKIEQWAIQHGTIAVAPVFGGTILSPIPAWITFVKAQQ